MNGWRWLTAPQAAYRWGFAVRVLLKAALLFALLNVLFALLNPLPALGRLSLYNGLIPGRERLPYGVDASQSYNLSPDILTAMFASHEVAGRRDDEYRVFLIGDSATWGYLLRPDETLAARINAAELRLEDGRRVQVYNLGYPTMSLTKDLLLLDAAMEYEPDMIVWLVTLESFPPDQQLDSPLAQRNPDATRRLISAYDLDLDPEDERFVEPDWFGRTIVGQRRALADLLRLQVYGALWAATGIDQDYPDTYEARQEDFEPDYGWHGLEAPQPLTEDMLAFDVLEAGISRAGDTPIVLINEPMFISSGRNSDIRYNFFYPRWVYDAYRSLLGDLAEARGWTYLDLWDAIAPTEFTDSAVHMTAEGNRLLSERVAGVVGANPSP